MTCHVICNTSDNKGATWEQELSTIPEYLSELSTIPEYLSKLSTIPEYLSELSTIPEYLSPPTILLRFLLFGL